MTPGAAVFALPALLERFEGAGEMLLLWTLAGRASLGDGVGSTLPRRDVLSTLVGLVADCLLSLPVS